MPNPRKTAFEALKKINTENGYSNLVADAALKNAGLSPRDRALAAALMYGVTERRVTLDYIISQYSSKPLKKLCENVLEALRIGIYQLMYMDKIPESAAVNQSVILVKETRDRYASGFVNAVLRSAVRGGRNFELPADEKKRFAVEYSVGDEIAKMICDGYGTETAAKYFDSCFGRPPVTVRVNTLKTDAASLAQHLAADGVECEEAPICKNALNLSFSGGGIEQLYGFADGLFYAEDCASQLCCAALDPRPGETILDLCAAPGGKSFTCAQLMNNSGEITANDIYPARVGLISGGAERLGIKIIKTAVSDAALPNPSFAKKYDRILCDLPCSGLGVLRRRPEIRYKNVAILDTLYNIQYNILNTGAEYLRVGGRLVMSTCTLNPRENGLLSQRFLSEHPDFKPVEISPDVARAIDEPPNNLTLFTHIHNTDGFFMSAFERVR